jgi:6-phosphofructokinase 1|uniref:Pyrophosphate--fructose 6-phosphate 1-phosphotransferase n=1 Tax=Caldisericum exile TaxID=693075 RepID=A0A7C4Y4I6_9BACT
MKIGILTGGGDCPGLNPAIRSVVYRASDYGDEVIGFEEGWKGLIEDKKRPLTIKDVEEIINYGGTILYTSRTNPFKEEKGPEKVVETLKKNNVDALIAIGGDDTLSVALKLHKMGVKVVGVPKTMDNDLSETDYTFGFFTSVEVAVDALNRLRDTARSHKRIIVLEVMGREAGWVALYTGIAGGADWILIPEEKPDYDKMCAHLKKKFDEKGYALVVVSEGIEIPLEATTEVDEFGHTLLQKRGVHEYVANVISQKLGISTRSAIIGHIQRGGPPTVFDRILATMVGVKAVDMLHEGDFGKMVALSGNRAIAIPLERAVQKQKLVDEEWIKFMRIFEK